MPQRDPGHREATRRPLERRSLVYISIGALILIIIILAILL